MKATAMQRIPQTGYFTFGKVELTLPQKYFMNLAALISVLHSTAANASGSSIFLPDLSCLYVIYPQQTS